ncbi:ABC transporter substrate-binding protein [Haladaptatus sp. NG-WS-4]
MRHETVSRREYLRGASALGLASIAGVTEAQGQTLEVQHWWTGGDGSKAIQALFDGFEQRYPDVTVNQNPVSGGAGQNLHTVIQKRVLNNNPPSSWQAWPGANLRPYTEANKLKDIGGTVWTNNDMKQAYLKGPKQAAKPAGSYVTVPLNIHRLNNLFYNVSVVEEAGVNPGNVSKPSDIVRVLKRVQGNSDAVGMAHQTKSPWSTLQLWAQVVLGEHGAETYDAITQGNVQANQQAVRNSLEIVKRCRQYFNQDAGSIDWQQANKKIINGKAAFIHQGDWAAGMYRAQQGFEFERDWNHVPFPGTSGMYALNMDSFPYPKNNPSPKATNKFLRYVGSVDAQERFNPKKGSISPRTDVSKDPFGPFLRGQMRDFRKSNNQPPSIAHGLAVPPETLTNLSDVMATFTSNWNVQQASQGIARAFQ